MLAQVCTNMKFLTEFVINGGKKLPGMAEEDIMEMPRCRIFPSVISKILRTWKKNLRNLPSKKNFVMFFFHRILFTLHFNYFLFYNLETTHTVHGWWFQCFGSQKISLQRIA